MASTIVLVVKPDIYVNTIASDAMAPLVARPSATMALTVPDRQVLVLHEEGFEQPVVLHSLSV